MKQLLKTRISILIAVCLLIINVKSVFAQETETPVPSLTLRYFTKANSIQYLTAQTKIKIERKFQPLPNQTVKLFLDSTGSANQITQAITDDNGMAKVIIPPSLKDKWDESPKHIIMGVMEDTITNEETTEELEITKAKIEIDTTSEEGVRTINVKLLFPENGEWVPAPDVDMKVGIERLGGILSAGDEAIYTTDENGSVSVTLNKDSIPGDEHGDIVLAAKVEDNDQFGNLLIEKKVPWGVALKPDKNFFGQRTLWSTRFRTPIWLLFMAYSIVIGVWGTLIYLVIQIVKISKLGKAAN